MRLSPMRVTVSGITAAGLIHSTYQRSTPATTAALIAPQPSSSSSPSTNEISDGIYLSESERLLYTDLLNVYLKLKNLPDFIHIPRFRPAPAASTAAGDSARSSPNRSGGVGGWDADPILLSDTDDCDVDDLDHLTSSNANAEDVYSLQSYLYQICPIASSLTGLIPDPDPLQFVRDDFVPPSDLARDPGLGQRVAAAQRHAARGQYAQALDVIRDANRHLDEADDTTAAAIGTGQRLTNLRIYLLLVEHRIQGEYGRPAQALIAAGQARDLLNGVLLGQYRTVNTSHPVNSLVHSALGQSAWQLGWRDLSLRCLYAALEMRLQYTDPMTGSDSALDQIISLNNVGACLGNRSRPDQAFVFMSVAFDLCRQSLPETHPILQVLIENLDRIRHRAKHLFIPDSALIPSVSIPNTFRVGMEAWHMPNLISGKKKSKGGGKKKKKK